ncbi:MAG: Fe-S protein assembly co-chaperone HscB [Flavobacteriales bacterium]|nr:Fe-S protein assembly co-chaperone HscB [Flavobacteriales bacterium]
MKNFFEHFGVEVSFLPDLEKIRKRYLQISRENHPDFSVGNSDEDYEQALMATSLNNQAWKTLNDTDERIKYVLDLLNVSLTQEDKLSTSFLMEMMEWNERITDAQMEENMEEIKNISTDFALIETQTNDRLMSKIEAFERSGDKNILTEIKEIYLQRKYILRLRNSIDKFAAL